MEYARSVTLDINAPLPSLEPSPQMLNEHSAECVDTCSKNSFAKVTNVEKEWKVDKPKEQWV